MGGWWSQMTLQLSDLHFDRSRKDGTTQQRRECKRGKIQCPRKDGRILFAGKVGMLKLWEVGWKELNLFALFLTHWGRVRSYTIIVFLHAHGCSGMAPSRRHSMRTMAGGGTSPPTSETDRYSSPRQYQYQPLQPVPFRQPSNGPEKKHVSKYPKWH